MNDGGLYVDTYDFEHDRRCGTDVLFENLLFMQEIRRAQEKLQKAEERTTDEMG